MNNAKGEDDFYVVLPSNVPSSIKNTPSKYLTTFDNPIYLVGEWEVALVEINFKNSIKTINNDEVIAEEIETNTKPLKNGVLVDPNNEMKVKDLPEGLIKRTDKTSIIKWHVIRNTKVMLTDKESTEFIIGFENNQYFIKNLTDYDMDITLHKYLARAMGYCKAEDEHVYSDEKYTISFLQKHSTKYAPYAYSLNGWLPFQPIDPVKTLWSAEYTLKYYKKSIKRQVNVKPRQGTYSTGKDLETELNKTKEFSNQYKFYYDVHLNRFEIETVNYDRTKNKHILLLNGLNDVLGFSKTKYEQSETIIKAEMDLNLLRGISSIFVYCDLCQDVRIGNTLAPLLRNVAFNTTKYGEQVNITYNNLIYIPISKSFIDTIQVHLCDAIGETIPFVEGLTTCVLHFKRRI